VLALDALALRIARLVFTRPRAHDRWQVKTTLLSVLIYVCAAQVVVSAQRVSVKNGRFAVDGVPRFLTFISYFGGMGAVDSGADLAFISGAGFDGIRLWPNSPDGPQLMRADGTIRADVLSRLLSIVDRAKAVRLIVDVTFTAEHINGLDASHYEAALVAATTALRSRDNLLFDLQNERNVYGPFGRPLPLANVRRIVQAVKRVDPDRLVTASNSGTPLAESARFTRAAGLDVTAYHEPRDTQWYQAARIRSIVDALAAAGQPVYLQEPSRYPFPSTDRADYFEQARANARAAGAAAWCFHTDLSFNLRAPRPPFEQLLRGRPEPDWAFVRNLLRFK
jgi:hypothetical protein